MTSGKPGIQSGDPSLVHTHTLLAYTHSDFGVLSSLFSLFKFKSNFEQKVNRCTFYYVKKFKSYHLSLFFLLFVWAFLFSGLCFWVVFLVGLFLRLVTRSV